MPSARESRFRFAGRFLSATPLRLSIARHSPDPGIVPQDVYTVLRQLRSTRRAQHAILHHLSGQRLAVVLA